MLALIAQVEGLHRRLLGASLPPPGDGGAEHEQRERDAEGDVEDHDGDKKHVPNGSRD